MVLSLPRLWSWYDRQPAAVVADPVEGFAVVCGFYLALGDISSFAALQINHADLTEYQHSIVHVVATYRRYLLEQATAEEVIQAYRRHVRAIYQLPGEQHTILIGADCDPGTILGDHWEAIKQAAQAAG